MNKFLFVVVLYVFFVLIQTSYGEGISGLKSVATDKYGNIYLVGRTEAYGYGINKYNKQGAFLANLSNQSNDIHLWLNSFKELDKTNVLEIKIHGRKIHKSDIYMFARYLHCSPEAEIMKTKILLSERIVIGFKEQLYALGSDLIYKNGRIGIIDPNDGHTILAFGEFTREDTPYGLWNPYGIAADSAGNMYIANQGPYCVKKYDKNGKFIVRWGKRGSGDGEFANPVSIAVDKRNDNVYVVDSYSSRDGWSQMRIQKFTKDGKFLQKWGEHFGLVWQPLEYISITYPILTNINELDTPAGIAVNSEGYVYVIESGKDRVHKFDENGQKILSFGGTGTGPGQFNMPGTLNVPIGIAIDKDDNVYVCDEDNNRVQKFDENGKFLMEIK